MDNDIYPNPVYVKNLCDLFEPNIYNKIVLKKHTTRTPSDLIFEKRDNKETKFIINFISNARIEVTVPIKYKNYLYTTEFNPQHNPQHNPQPNTLDLIYEYLRYHISFQAVQ